MKTTIEMAREAGIRDCTCDGVRGCLERLVELVRADERNRTWTQEHWTEYERSIAAVEQQRIVNLLMIKHEAAKGAHNYWHVAAQLIQADVASNT